MKPTQAITILVMMSVCGAALAMIRPAVPFKDLHPIDACLFGCNMCFENEYLLECANKVCLGELASGKELGRFWAKMSQGSSGSSRSNLKESLIP